MSLTQISLDADTLSRLDKAASSRSLSREDALREAVDTYLDAVTLRSEVAAGRADLGRGDVYTDAEVEDYFTNKRQQLLDKIAL